MGFIDRAKRLRLAIINRVHSQRVVFHHVPKCGGTSVGRALRKKYILSQATIMPDSSFRAVEPFSNSLRQEDLYEEVFRFREKFLLYLLFEDVRCISAHVHFSEVAYERFKDSYKFITILRDPISRFVSHFNWSKLRISEHDHVNENFEAFVKSDRARRFGSMYVRYFSGLPTNVDLQSREAIESAIRNLKKFDAVGLLHDLNTFEATLHNQLGIRLHIGHENRRTGNSASNISKLIPDVQAEIENICYPDLEIWRHFASNT